MSPTPCQHSDWASPACVLSPVPPAELYHMWKNGVTDRDIQPTKPVSSGQPPSEPSIRRISRSLANSSNDRERKARTTPGSSRLARLALRSPLSQPTNPCLFKGTQPDTSAPSRWVASRPPHTGQSLLRRYCPRPLQPVRNAGSAAASLCPPDRQVRRRNVRASDGTIF